MSGVASRDMGRCCGAARACGPSGARGRGATAPPGRARSAAPGGPGRALFCARRQLLAAGQHLGMHGGAAGAMEKTSSAALRS